LNFRANLISHYILINYFSYNDNKKIEKLASETQVLVLKTFQDFGRPDIKDLDRNLFLPSPPLVKAGNDAESGFNVISNSLGFSETNNLLTLITPLGKVKIYNNLLKHITEKRIDARERFSNFIFPTLQDPFEIYEAIVDGKLTCQFIGLFDGRFNLLVTTTVIVGKPMLFRNMMHADDRRINKHRKGVLIYAKRTPSKIEGVNS
jgi:hypothetical protein